MLKPFNVKIYNNILCEMMLLNENVSTEDVNKAIDNRERIVINYHTNGEDKNTCPRLVEPYAYGLTKAGNPVIRGFQPFGDTTTRTPNWKFFRLDRITGWKPTGQKFDKPADVYYKGLGEFNPNGDDSMSVVYKIVNFNDNSTDVNFNTKNGPKTKSDEIFKTDTEKQMDKLKNQLDNPINISDFKTTNGFKGVEKSPMATSGPKLKNDNSQDKSDEIFKTDTEKQMDKLKNQLNNPTYLSDLNKNSEDELNNLRQKLGNTDNPIPFKDLQQKLNQEDEIFKTDTEKQMDKLKNQLNNPEKIDLTKIPKR